MGTGGFVPCVEVVVTSSRSRAGAEMGEGQRQKTGQTGERERYVVVRRVHVPREYAEMHLWLAGAGAGSAGRGVWDQT